MDAWLALVRTLANDDPRKITQCVGFVLIFSEFYAHGYHNSAFEKILDADQTKYGPGDRTSYTIASGDGDEYQGTVDAVIG